MTIALDIGTSRLRSLRRVGFELVGRSVPASFALVADDPIARDLLTRAELPFATGDGELALIGDAGLEHARAFRSIPNRLLNEGQVPRDDPPARHLLETLVESILPKPIQLGDLCSILMTPSSYHDRDSRAFLTRLVQARGYDPIVISPSLAVVHATLAEEDFSGIGFTLGAGGCSISLVHRGRELLWESVGRGTDWIDHQIARSTETFTYDSSGRKFLDLETVRREREQMSESIAAPSGDFAQEVTAGYRDIIEEVLQRFIARLTHERLTPYALESVMSCGGGGVRTPGFDAFLTNLIRDIDFPVPLRPLQMAAIDDYLIARGALIYAEVESPMAVAA